MATEGERQVRRTMSQTPSVVIPVIAKVQAPCVLPPIVGSVGCNRSPAAIYVLGKRHAGARRRVIPSQARLGLCDNVKVSRRSTAERRPGRGARREAH